MNTECIHGQKCGGFLNSVVWGLCVPMKRKNGFELFLKYFSENCRNIIIKSTNSVISDLFD